MPRPSLTDEIMDLVKQYGRCCWRAGAFEDVQRRCDESGRGDLLGVSIYSRLSALEQELEGYRKEKAEHPLAEFAQAVCDKAKQSREAWRRDLIHGTSSGTVFSSALFEQAAADIAARQTRPPRYPAWVLLPAPECSPRHASLDEAFACERCNNPARVAAIYAKLPPGWDKLPDTPEPWPTPLLEIANENLRAWMERHPNPAAQVALPTAHSATSGVPCSSEYLSAQTGYDDEDGG